MLYVDRTIGLHHLDCPIYPSSFSLFSSKSQCIHVARYLWSVNKGVILIWYVLLPTFPLPKPIHINTNTITPPFHHFTLLLSTPPLTPFNRYPLLRQATLYMPHHPSCSIPYLFLSILHHCRLSIPYATTITTTTTTTTNSIKTVLPTPPLPHLLLSAQLLLTQLLQPAIPCPGRP